MSDIASKATFVDACLAGDALPEDIADYIDAWHDGESALPVYEFLGLKREDYALYVEKPRSLRIILAAYRSNVPVMRLLRDEDEVRLAARTTDTISVRELREWLRMTGRIGR